MHLAKEMIDLIADALFQGMVADFLSMIFTDIFSSVIALHYFYIRFEALKVQLYLLFIHLHRCSRNFIFVSFCDPFASLHDEKVAKKHDLTRGT